MTNSRRNVLDVQAFVNSFMFAILDRVTDPSGAFVRLDPILRAHAHGMVAFSDEDREEIVMLLNHEILEVFGFDFIAEVQRMKGD